MLSKCVHQCFLPDQLLEFGFKRKQNKTEPALLMRDVNMCIYWSSVVTLVSQFEGTGCHCWGLVMAGAPGGSCSHCTVRKRESHAGTQLTPPVLIQFRSTAPGLVPYIQGGRSRCSSTLLGSTFIDKSRAAFPQ